MDWRQGTYTSSTDVSAGLFNIHHKTHISYSMSRQNIFTFSLKYSYRCTVPRLAALDQTPLCVYGMTGSGDIH